MGEAQAGFTAHAPCMESLCESTGAAYTAMQHPRIDWHEHRMGGRPTAHSVNPAASIYSFTIDQVSIHLLWIQSDASITALSDGVAFFTRGRFSSHEPLLPYTRRLISLLALRFSLLEHGVGSLRSPLSANRLYGTVHSHSHQ